ncbi:MAG: hypothetical protein ACRD01_13885 [Terriglobales bacterium]
MAPWLCGTLLCLLGLGACHAGPQPGHVQDEAQLAGRSPASFPPATEDYFHAMDGGIPLTPDEIKGRDVWLVWSGGDDRLWDSLTDTTFGAVDLLKTLSSYPGLKARRGNRWQYLGLVNEPCFRQATGPDPNRYGLWLDSRDSTCPPDPFENAAQYPGVKLGARGKTIPAGSYYGYASGVVGLRLFPNPAFDAAAAKAWDSKRYYTDPSYYNSKKLVRPYRVGMSCGFCHVGPSPTHPPADPENPRWADLNSIVGAQYFWVDRVLSWQADPSNFIVQLLHTSRPGTLDTSLISSDNINNPRTMNAFYGLPARMTLARRWGQESLQGGARNNQQLNDYFHSGPLTAFFQSPDTVWSPHVLKDASDSVGVLGALNRVYLNIGLFSEEWMLHFRPMIGGAPITPIQITVANKNSAYWDATQNQTPYMAEFLLKAGAGHRLRDAPGGAAYLTHDAAVLGQGKIVFADTCARCHSSKIPTPAPGLDPAGCSGKDYLRCWSQYWTWTGTNDFKTRMRAMVLRPDFLDNNYLSTDFRVPITLLQTNACSALATNAIRGNIWDNFSSETYKDLPSVGSITVYNPLTGAPSSYTMPAGGRGYTRPPSLISLWSTAPFLLNNSLGQFNPSPSVTARMASFQNSIEQLLWPAKREKDTLLPDKLPGTIDRTTETSYLRIPIGYLPASLKPMLGLAQRVFPTYFSNQELVLGPIPKGTPVDLLANLDILGEASNPADKLKHQRQVLSLLLKLQHDLAALPPHATDQQARQVFANLVPGMMALSKCPDFVVNRGHYFGTSRFSGEPALSDSQKRALIEYLKTF